MVNISLIALIVSLLIATIVGVTIGLAISRKSKTTSNQENALFYKNFLADRYDRILKRISQESINLSKEQAQLLENIAKILLLAKDGSQIDSANKENLEQLSKEWQEAKRHFVELGKQFRVINRLLDEISNLSVIPFTIEHFEGGPVFTGQINNSGGHITGRPDVNIESRFAGDTSTDAPPPDVKKKKTKGN